MLDQWFSVHFFFLPLQTRELQTLETYLYSQLSAEPQEKSESPPFSASPRRHAWSLVPTLAEEAYLFNRLKSRQSFHKIGSRQAYLCCHW